MSLFIPPPGAMQFEVTHVRREGSKCILGKAFWIEGKPTPGTVSNELCHCADKRRIVIDSLSDDIRDIVLRRMRAGYGHPVVCNCVGRIIE